ncbi:MAG TPA: Flp family type IVb pilin [Acetobacteraceae bacterium]|nr:Flp family type IVb pilin [Acetobacteraceae bacterium]
MTDRRGVTAIEYGLIAAIIVSAIALAFPFLATGVGGLLTKVATSFPASAAAT